MLPPLTALFGFVLVATARLPRWRYRRRVRARLQREVVEVGR